MEEAPGATVFDTAVLILAERDFKEYAALRAALAAEGIVPMVPVPVLAEVWRNGARQANLARVSKALEMVDCLQATARRAGELLAATGGDNAMDAIVVATAEQRNARVITGDPMDLDVLAGESRGVAVLALNDRV